MGLGEIGRAPTGLSGEHAKTRKHVISPPPALSNQITPCLRSQLLELSLSLLINTRIWSVSEKNDYTLYS
jgi:hypothetical protein